MRVAERRLLRRGLAAPATTHQTSSFFPFATISSLLTIVFLTLFTYPASVFLGRARHALASVHDPSFVPFLATAAQLPATVLLIVAAYLHYASSHRKWKYELIISFGLIGWWCTGFVHAGLTVWGGQWSFALPFNIAFGFFFWWLLFLLAQPAMSRLVRWIEKRGRLNRWYYRFQARIWWFIAVAFLPALVLYCLFRYHLVAAVSRRPILYFRSFSAPTVPTAFREIVIKGARRYGVLEGLVSDEQRASDLHAQAMEIVDHAHFAAANATEWQRWVSWKLTSAAAVIIDATESSESVAWEINQAIATIGASRLVILYSGEPPDLNHVSVRYLLRYGLSPAELKKARSELSAWLRDNLLQP